jgi:poly-gamma-glutamate system protein
VPYQIDTQKKLTIAFLAVVAVGCQVTLEATRTEKRMPYYEVKLEASHLAARAFEVLRSTRLSESAVLDLSNDPAGTGLIGPEFSLITNSRGLLSAKLTTLNPNFAAVIVDYFERIKLRKGDPVAVAVSGSFPGLNVCVYAALAAMELQPTIITSVGASNWGANDPDFTWLDMERVLDQEEVFDFYSVAASPGGADDMGRGLSPEGRRLIWEAIDRNGVTRLESRNIEESIDKRMEIYAREASPGRVKAYVNVGGGIASLGSSQNRALIPPGLSTDLGLRNYPRKGVIIRMAQKGIPVIHLNQIESIARRFGLPVAPEYLPGAGEGEVFTRTAYNVWVAAGLLALYLLLTFGLIIPGFRDRLFGRGAKAGTHAG